MNFDWFLEFYNITTIYGVKVRGNIPVKQNSEFSKSPHIRIGELSTTRLNDLLSRPVKQACVVALGEVGEGGRINGEEEGQSLFPSPNALHRLPLNKNRLSVNF